MIVWRALSAALVALVVGTLAYAVTETLRVLLSPGLEFDSLGALIVAVPLLVLEGFAWGILGGAMYVLPVTWLLFAWRASRAPGRPDAPAATLAIAVVAFLPVFLYALHDRPLDAALLLLSVWIGVRAGLGRLATKVPAA